MSMSIVWHAICLSRARSFSLLETSLDLARIGSGSPAPTPLRLRLLVSGTSYLGNACGANLYTQLPPAHDLYPSQTREQCSQHKVYFSLITRRDGREKSRRPGLDPKDYNWLRWISVAVKMFDGNINCLWFCVTMQKRESLWLAIRIPDRWRCRWTWTSWPNQIKCSAFQLQLGGQVPCAVCCVPQVPLMMMPSLGGQGGGDTLRGEPVGLRRGPEEDFGASSAQCQNATRKAVNLSRGK